MSVENINQSPELQLTPEFREEFEIAFGMTPEELHSAPMQNTLGSVDANYLGRVLLGRNANVMWNLANMNQRVSRDFQHFGEAWDTIKSYVYNAEFSQDEFREFMKEDGFGAIAEYIIENFPKSAFTQTKTAENVARTMR